MPTNEAGLVAAMHKAVHKKYPHVWVFKVVGSPYQMSGVPDMLFCIDGVLFGAEAKFPRPGESDEHAKGRATPGQLVQIDKINRAGGYAAVVTSVAETLDLIEHGLREHEEKTCRE